MEYKVLLLWCFSVYNRQATSTGLRWILVETCAFRHLSSQAGSTRKRRSGLGGLENQSAWTIFFFIGPTPLWSPNTPLDQKDSLLAALYGCARLFLLPSLHS